MSATKYSREEIEDRLVGLTPDQTLGLLMLVEVAFEAGRERGVAQVVRALLTLDDRQSSAN